MASERWERWAAYAAIGYVVLLGLAIALTADVPSPEDSPAAWASFFDENSGRFVASGFLVLAGGALSLFWLGAVRAVLGRAEPGMPGLASLAVYGGLVGLVFMLAGAAVGTAYPAAVELYDGFGGDGQLAMLLNTASYWVGTMGLAGAVVMSGAVAAIGFRTTLFPRWFAWLSATVAVLQAAGGVVWPVAGVLGMGWTLVFAILVLRGGARAGSRTASS